MAGGAAEAVLGLGRIDLLSDGAVEASVEEDRVVMAAGAFTLARLEELRQEAPAYGVDSAPQRAAGQAPA